MIIILDLLKKAYLKEGVFKQHFSLKKITFYKQSVKIKVKHETVNLYRDFMSYCIGQIGPDMVEVYDHLQSVFAIF